MALFSAMSWARRALPNRSIASSVISHEASPSCPARLRSVWDSAAMDALASASFVAKIGSRALIIPSSTISSSRRSRVSAAIRSRRTRSKSCARRCLASSERSSTSASSARKRSGASTRWSRPSSTIASSASSRIELLSQASAPAVAFWLQT
ncbi:hypothetical protein [uncultured Sphingomonas sp.]|uniref:hypothetical protein n=1 Tax=uncultured Sphingomonas sp. TaxID=158754 RepID=UPI00374A0421